MTLCYVQSHGTVGMSSSDFSHLLECGFVLALFCIAQPSLFVLQYIYLYSICFWLTSFTVVVPLSHLSTDMLSWGSKKFDAYLLLHLSDSDQMICNVNFNFKKLSNIFFCAKVEND